jgi:two-component system nitrogen regulation response regulator NtrX
MVNFSPDDRARVILIVDEAREVSRLLRGFFARRGFEVGSASNAQEALAWVEDRRPDIVLVDVCAKRCDGLNLLDKLAGPDHGLTVIAMAKEADCEEARESLRRGASDFMAKPLNLAYLETSLWAEFTGAGGRGE